MSAKVPSRLEPADLLGSDGKRPDGMTITPWSRGRLLVWDATCCDVFAASHIGAAVSEPGAVAAKAEDNKVSGLLGEGVSSNTRTDPQAKSLGEYLQVLPSGCLLSVSASGGGNVRYFRASSGGVFRELGRRVRRATLEPNAYQYLVQRISVAVQRGNAASVLGSLGSQPSVLGDL